MPPRPGQVTLLVLLLGCGGGSTPDPRLPQEGDAVAFEKVLQGTIPPAEGFAQVARSSGWPIATSRGYVFAVEDAGMGPYAVSSPSGAFGRTALAGDHGVFWALLPIADPDAASYQFLTRFGDPFPDAWSRRFGYDADKREVSLVAARGAHFDRWPGVGDAKIAPRTLRVWVPQGAATHYLYAHDGQNLFNPLGPWNGWDLQHAAGPSTLVIGIDNSPGRMDEYTPVPDVISGSTVGGTGDAYSDYVLRTVRPLIETHYGKPARNGLVGSSLGGLIAFHQALRDPAEWDFAASLSGTMGWGSIGPGAHARTAIEEAQALASCPAAVLYLDSGGGPGTGCVDSDGDGIEDDTASSSDNYCENQQLLRVLRGKGCSVTSVWAQGAQHNESQWRQRAPAICAQFEAL